MLSSSIKSNYIIFGVCTGWCTGWMKSSGEKQPGTVAGTLSSNGNYSAFHIRSNMRYTISYLKKYNMHESVIENKEKLLLDCISMSNNSIFNMLQSIFTSQRISRKNTE